jgi:hypothetical protein
MSFILATIGTIIDKGYHNHRISQAETTRSRMTKLYLTKDLNTDSGNVALHLQ